MLEKIKNFFLIIFSILGAVATIFFIFKKKPELQSTTQIDQQIQQKEDELNNIQVPNLNDQEVVDYWSKHIGDKK
jgi:hypothetical protein